MARTSKATGPTETCPWCSATVPAAAATCPSCGASLKESAEVEILGVTQVDPAATSKAARMTPGRIATWLGAEKPVESDLGGRLEPPSDEVRQEMLKLRLAAIDAELETQVAAAKAQRDLLAAESPDAARDGDASGNTGADDAATAEPKGTSEDPPA